MTTANLNPPAADQSKTEGHDDSTAITANDSNAADTYTARMARQTAAVALNAVLTATPAADVARLAADADERDFPAVDYWQVFTTAAAQTLQALKRWRWQQAADAVRLLHYAAHLERLAKRAGVIPE